MTAVVRAQSRFGATPAIFSDSRFRHADPRGCCYHTCDLIAIIRVHNRSGTEHLGVGSGIAGFGPLGSAASGVAIASATSRRGRADPSCDEVGYLALVSTKPMVTACHPGMGYAASDAFPRGFELFGRGEGVPVAGDEQGGGGNRWEVIAARAFGSTRWMEWVADQDQRGGWETLADRHRAHSTAHRSPAHRDIDGTDPELFCEFRGCRSHCRDEHCRSIWSAAAGKAVGEVDPPNNDFPTPIAIRRAP